MRSFISARPWQAVVASRYLVAPAAMCFVLCGTLQSHPPIRPRSAPWEIESSSYTVVEEDEVTEEPQSAGEAPPTLERGAARRSPGSVLGAMVVRQSGELPAPLEDEPPYLAALRISALAGDWVGVKATIAELPEETRAVAYGQLLALLAAGGLVMTDEIDAIADAAPGDLTDAHVALLGAILRRASAQNDAPKQWLAALKLGTARFGGDNPAKRLAAARLLLAAGMLDEAAKFLPPLADALQAGDAELLNFHARVEQGRLARGDAAAADRAWKILLAALADADASKEQREETIGRLILLIDKLPMETSGVWLREQFQDHPDRGLLLLAIATQQAEAIYAAGSRSPREASLATIHRLAAAVLDAGETDPAWREPLQMLALMWLHEAQKAAGESQPILIVEDEDEIRPLKPQALLATQPSQRWLQVLPPDTAALALRLTAHFSAAAGDWEATRRQALTIEDNATRQKLVDTFLDAWAVELAPNSGELEQLMDEYRRQGYSGARLVALRQQALQQLMDNRSDEGTALTRAAQVLQLEKLGKLLAELRQSGLPSPSADKLAEVFAGCHSPAEVFRADDIESVFGPLGELPPAIAAALTHKMRQNLAQEWRSLKVQELAGTQRTDQEVVREIRRGYALAIEITNQRIARAPSDAGAQLTLAQLTFDMAEFLYGIGVDLATYTKTRDEAFATFGKAADVYAASLPKRTTEEYSADVYLLWFQAALGASDLSYLTRQDAADTTQVERVAAALRELDSPWRDAHLTLFGQGLDENIAEIPPQLKPICLRQSLVVLGENAAGDAARKLLQYYDELLGELELHLDIDGRDAVGHGQPFGARLALRYSQPLGREGMGFTSLLETTYDPDTGDALDHKEKLTQEIREKLEQGFDVRDIRFHDPNVQPRSFGRRGWRETPLAYLVLAARDPSIDTIPPLQVDLQFRDTSGSVLLPIVSRPVLVDARSAAPAARPCEVTGIKQLLDDRQWPSDDLRLEITAAGRGLIPPLSELVDLSEGAEHGGLRVAAIEDRGLALHELEATDDGIRPRCERTWLVSFTTASKSAAELPSSFAFPATKIKAVPLTRERYADADVTDCDAVVALPVGGQQALAKFGWPTAAGVFALAGLVLVGLAVGRSWRQPAAPPAYVLPVELTPFSVLSVLKRMRTDERLRLSASDRGALQSAIADLEEQNFARDEAPTETRELKAALNRWWPRTRGIAAIG